MSNGQEPEPTDRVDEQDVAIPDERDVEESDDSEDRHAPRVDCHHVVTAFLGA